MSSVWSVTTRVGLSLLAVATKYKIGKASALRLMRAEGVAIRLPVCTSTSARTDHPLEVLGASDSKKCGARGPINL